ncbi:1625_t:CDS:1, partial [Scutellospora calospora]
SEADQNNKYNKQENNIIPMNELEVQLASTYTVATMSSKTKNLEYNTETI